MKNNLLIRIICILIVINLIACNNQKTETKIALVKKASQSVLSIPEGIKVYAPFDHYVMDSIKIASSPLKVYVSLNLSCPSCLEKLASWKLIAQELSKNNVPLILVGHADDKFELIKYLCKSKAIGFPYPFFLDKKGSFLADNKVISESGELNAVLTDERNNILSAGDILNFPEVKTAFFNKLKKR